METRTELIVFLFSDDQYLFLLERGGLRRAQRDEERIELHTMLCAGYKVLTTTTTTNSGVERSPQPA